MKSESLPSKCLTVINIPEPSFQKAEFIYNFYKKDEMVNEMGNEEVLISEESNNSQVIEDLKFTTPRYIILNFGGFESLIETIGRHSNKSHLVDPSDESLIHDIISKNIDNIQTESAVGGGNFVSIALQDEAGSKKIIDEIYSAARIARLIDDGRALSPMELTLLLQSQTSDFLDLTDILKDAEITQNNDISYIDPKTGKRYEGQFDELNELSFACSFDSQYYDSIASRAAEAPFSPFFESFSNSLIEARRLSRTASFSSTPGTLKESEFSINIVPIKGVEGYGEVLMDTDGNGTLSEDDAAISFFDLKFGEPTFQVIGLIIDKFEILEDGSEIRKEPIIITNQNASRIIDKKVKYGTSYRYALSTIGILRNYEFSEEYEDYVRVDSLIRSRGGQGKIVRCVETVPPLPPQDIHFKYDYEDTNVVILWNPPVNPQRDIVRYQIFRRLSVHDQFDLIGQIDFDQSVVKQERSEEIPNELNHLHNVPKYKFVDTSYDRSKSYIYALCSVDAHDLSSNYSMQYKVDFNTFRNQMLVSKFANRMAMKPFPNITMPETLTEDSIKVSGYKKLKVYFKPDTFSLNNSNGENVDFLDIQENHLSDPNASNKGYKLQLINLDRQVARTIDIKIKDIRTN